MPGTITLASAIQRDHNSMSNDEVQPINEHDATGASSAIGTKPATSQSHRENVLDCGAREQIMSNGDESLDARFVKAMDYRFVDLKAKLPDHCTNLKQLDDYCNAK